MRSEPTFALLPWEREAPAAGPWAKHVHILPSPAPALWPWESQVRPPARTLPCRISVAVGARPYWEGPLATGESFVSCPTRSLCRGPLVTGGAGPDIPLVPRAAEPDAGPKATAGRVSEVAAGGVEARLSDVLHLARGLSQQGGCGVSSVKSRPLGRQETHVSA